jgi:hypothetical protein
MIDKRDFYHGVAVLRVVDDPRCLSILKDTFGYAVNGELFFVVKYSTAKKSPWQFTITEDEFNGIEGLMAERIFVVFVCGGDGMCGAPWEQVRTLLGAKPGWISVRRRFGGWYGIKGTEGKLDYKIPGKNWPAILFEVEGAVDVQSDDLAQSHH